MTIVDHAFVSTANKLSSLLLPVTRRNCRGKERAGSSSCWSFFFAEIHEEWVTGAKKKAKRPDKGSDYRANE
jgi:hypothetical protein